MLFVILVTFLFLFPPLNPHSYSYPHSYVSIFLLHHSTLIPIPILILIPILNPITGSLLNVKAIVSLLAIPEVFYLIVLKLFVAIPVGVFHAMFPIVNIEKFDLTPQTNGYLLTYIGVLTAVR